MGGQQRQPAQLPWGQAVCCHRSFLAYYLQGRLLDSDSVAIVTLLAPAASAKDEAELEECRDVVGPNSLQVDGEWGYPVGLPDQCAILCQEERWELEVAEEFHPIPSHPTCSISHSLPDMLSSGERWGMKRAPAPKAWNCLLTFCVLKAVIDESPVMMGGKASEERAAQHTCGLVTPWL